jgi:Glyoxalase-like domain
VHRSRLCHFVIDVPDLEQGVTFWSAALDATEESLPEQSRPIYRRLRLPDSEIRILLQKTGDEKTSKERMHLDLESDDVEAEVADWKPSAPPAGSTKPNAALTSGSCATHGATNSAFYSRSSPNSWPGESPGITVPRLADQCPLARRDHDPGLPGLLLL